jgi:hypothetical protein
MIRGVISLALMVKEGGGDKAVTFALGVNME